jgi:ATP-binding cassette, subfamily B, bacterial PglK
MFKAVKKAWSIFDAKIKGRFGVLFVLMVIGALLEVGGIGAIYPVLESMFLDEGAKTSKVTSYALEFAVYLDIGKPLATLCLIAFFIITFKNIFLVFLLRFQLNFIWLNRGLLSSQVFKYYINNPYPFHLERNSADLLRNVTDGVTDIMIRMVLPSVSVATEVMVISAMAILLSAVAPMETLIAVITIGSISAAYYIFVRRPLLSWASQSFSESERMLYWVNQGLGGIKETKAMGCETFFSDAYHRSVSNLSNFQKQISFVSQLPRYVTETIFISGILLSIIFFLPTETEAISHLPVIGMFSMAVFRMLPSFNRITAAFGLIRGSIPAINQLHGDIQSAKQSLSKSEKQSSAPLKFENEILFDNISFQYENSDLVALQNIDIKIKHGQSIGIVGSSGAGKTTLVDILLGLLMPTSGKLSMDGVAITSNLDSWRSEIGYIPQDVFLIDDSLKRNIAFGLRDGEIEDGAVQEAVDQAHLNGFLDTLPEGLETTVGERGVRLSGGQRQRIGIARALYRKASILVMDEATSSLDSKTEAEISRSINELRGKQTIIIIAHRLSTVRQCDVIYFMEGGRIIDSGTFETLSQNNPTFKNMINLMDLSQKTEITS